MELQQATNEEMKLQNAKELVVETGKMLLEEHLVARTWGNVSARVSKDSFVISPSGLDYLQTTPDDLALVHLDDDLSWEGTRKPSSEKGIHAAAYEAFPDAGFVIHTHQDYASAMSVAGFGSLIITNEEIKTLGGLSKAKYGLPGTDKLMKNVRKKFFKWAKVVVMEHHGVVIVGTDRDDALKKAILLEEICKRSVKYRLTADVEKARAEGKEVLEDLKSTHPNAILVDTPEAIEVATKGMKIHAQLDDMAQMIGKEIPVTFPVAEALAIALDEVDAVVARDVGIFVNSKDEEDAQALALLAAKAAICALNADALDVEGRISAFDCTLMRFVYKNKYSKKKKG